MTGIILELQSEATNRDIRIPDLLRKTLLVAKKLNIEEIVTWVLAELNGYEDPSEVPKYRIVTGSIKAHNTFNGLWMPVMFSSDAADNQRRLSKRHCTQPISEIEALINNNPEQVGMQFSTELQNQMMQGADMPFPPVLILPASTLHGIMDSVRTAILEWALELEQKGVVGEGLSFSSAEKEAAANVSIHIENMTGSQIQAGTSNSTQSMTNEIEIEQVNSFVQQLEEALADLSLEDDTLQEISSEIATLKAQASSPKPKSGIIKLSLGTIKTVLEGAGGNIVAQGLMRLIEVII